MEESTVRLSIERRFILSILWVGVIPMVMALLIGYFAAREGQQISVMQNLSTAARKTVSGVRLVIQERERNTKRIAQSPEVIAWLRLAYRNQTTDDDSVRALFRKETAENPALNSSFYLYSPEGRALLSSDESEAPPLPGLEKITETRFIHLDYLSARGLYTALLVTPVVDPDTDISLGYMVEDQSVHELLELILDDSLVVDGGRRDRYEIVYFSETTQFAVLLDEEAGISPPPPRISLVHPRLAERLESSDKDQDAFLLWDYISRGVRVPVLMAYQRLGSHHPLYVVVHQPTPAVFRMINLAAGITLAVSFVIIAIFCAIAYRIVNNKIIRPLSLLNEGAQIIRQGDLDLKLRIETGDEIEELAASFNQMSSALRSNMRRLSASQDKYRHLITSMRDCLFQTNQKRQIIFINPAGVAILGYSRIDEVLGRPFKEFFVSEDDYEAVIHKLEEAPYVDSVRVWLNRFSDEPVCVEISGYRTFNENGQAQGIEGSFRDVTRSLHLEREVAERAERMITVNQIANVVNTSVEAGLVYENLLAELHKLVDFDYAGVSIMLDSNAHETRQIWPEPQEGPERFPRLDDDHSCAGWVAKSGRPLRIEDLQKENEIMACQFPPEVRSVLCVPLRAEQGVLGSLLLGSNSPGVFSDYEVHLFKSIAPHLAGAIRNARLLENLKSTLEQANSAKEKLDSANKELKSLDEMKTHLLSNVSHELRTPLVAVMGYADMMLNEKAGEINETQKEYLEIILRNVEKLVTLIENLLDFAKIHRSTEGLVFTSFDLIDCIRASMQVVKPVSAHRGIELKMNIHDEQGNSLRPPIQVEGDKGHLGQVFNNLLSNAVKFNREGGTVTVEVEVRKDAALIAVSDTGIGIPADAQDKIFTRFYQYDASSTRKYGGTGIGLSIAQDIIRLHGSRITVSSKPDEGTTFKFSLPLHTPSVLDAEGAGIKPLPIETHLLVELVSQDRSLCAQIRQQLISEGMDVIHAPYPAAAVSLAQKHNPDCIIIDSETGPLGSVLLEEFFLEGRELKIPLLLITDNDSLYSDYRDSFQARLRRQFRKSTLLSGIHKALSPPVLSKTPLGNKILCVDADMETATFMQRCLSDEGYEIEVAMTGEDALSILQTGDYWLLLLDIALPDQDGWDLCRHIKNHENLSGMKIQIVTARNISQSMPQMRECGADGYLLKPFKAEDILSLVKTFEIQRVRKSQPSSSSSETQVKVQPDTEIQYD
ncbi:MAG: response regulator [Candidatus Hydrogenedens sp.]|jgi:PAS domain S-box-containing protein|nr:response regulator [Candidatus Hydrogenedens sp.]